MDYRPFGLLDMTPGFPAGGVTGRTPSGADDLGRLLYSMTGAGGAQDAAGLLGGPSVRENFRSGNNFDAGLQMLAALPVVGMLGTAGKVARGAQDAARAAEEARGIIAYHGSPHSFDKFDLSKIGTGEGAQAYGHGLYFAESEPVAQMYRDNLSRRNIEATIDGRSIEKWPETVDEVSKDNWRLGKLLDEYGRVGGKYEDFVRQQKDWYRGQPEMESALDEFEKRVAAQHHPGSMYQVRINADPNAFLDWDKPFAEQSPIVQKTITTLAKTALEPKKGPSIRNRQAILNNDGSVPGDILYNNIGGHNFPAKTSSELREAGIPGIKYLDAGSRGAGEGSRNYVVFDDSLIDILKKYGLIGLLGGGAAASGVSGMNNPPSMPNSAPGL